MACIYLTSDLLRRATDALSRGIEEVSVSVDLNRSFVMARVSAGSLQIPGGVRLPLDWLAQAVREGLAYAYEEGRITPLESHAIHYCKLMPTPEAPTLVIDGVQMHQTKWRSPFEEARDKVQQVVKSGDCVLDTCGGLGYTAFWAARLGASRVVSVEVDEAVMELSTLNPWIMGREESSRILRVHGDAFEFVQECPQGAFDAIIHDPPRLSMAGELYGASFYRECFRILKHRGRMFHYVGKPGSRYRGKDIPGGVARRLGDAGFHVEPRERLLGLVAWKAQPARG